MLALVALTFIRMFAGILTKGLGAMFETPKPGGTTPPPKQAGGPLRRDPVCGTFVPEEGGIQAKIDGETVHFCSESCRDKFLRA
jgi:YHS domain-containing protein